MGKPILCVDFDGVLHSYTSGWKGAGVVSDPPVDGAIRWLTKAVKVFDVAIYSSRSKDPDGIAAMRGWLSDNGLCSCVLNQLDFPTQKPPAFLTIDDRAVCFNGKFDSPEDLIKFKPWNK